MKRFYEICGDGHMTHIFANGEEEKAKRVLAFLIEREIATQLFRREVDDLGKLEQSHRYDVEKGWWV